MHLFKKILKLLFFFICIPILYIVVSLVCSKIPVGETKTTAPKEFSVYLNTNGVHLDIVLPSKLIHSNIMLGIGKKEPSNFYSFGWGDENFYINTPEWSDLKASHAFKAGFLKSSTLMHVTRYETIPSDWIKVPISAMQLKRLNTYIHASFQRDLSGNTIPLIGESYGTTDTFYKAIGSYSFFKTCNTWANNAFKSAGLKSCLWTPFDFGLLGQYK